MTEEATEPTDAPAEKRPKKPRPQAKKPRPPQRVNGINIPPGSVRWRVHRFSDPTGKSRKDSEPCAVPGPRGSPLEGRRIEWFPVKEFPPAWEFVLAQWGSGSYRLQFWGEEGTKSSLGWSPLVTFDDPNHPQLPPYRGAPAAPPPAPEPSPGASDPLQAILGQAEGGKLDVALVVILFQLQQSQIQQQREWYAQREQDDRRRQDEIEKDHQRRLQARMVEFEQERKRTADFWAAESKRALERVQEADTGGGDDRFDDLADSIQTLAEKVESKGAESEQFWEKMVDKYIAPLVVARMSGATPAMGNGGGQ